MSERTIVIVGAGLAGSTTATTLREEGFGGRLVLVGAEAEPPYQRPPLSKDVLREHNPSFDTVRLEDPDRLAALEVELLLGEAACGLRARDRIVELRSGAAVAFDELVIASGSSPRKLGVPGEDLTGVTALRTWTDAIALSAAIERSRRVVIVGGGLIGLEVAVAVRARGRDAVVVEAGPRLLRRSVGALASARITGLLRDHGVTVELDAQVSRFAGPEQVEGVVLADGRRIGADHVLVAIGVEPATGWLAGSSVELGDGVLIDGSGCTSLPHILAAGDVACSPDAPSGRLVRTESFARAMWQARAAGHTILDRPVDAPPPFGISTELMGVRIQSIGDTSADEVIVRGDVTRASFSVFHVAGGVVRGATLVGRPRDWPLARRTVADAAAEELLRAS